jgi:hypothetical protein
MRIEFSRYILRGVTLQLRSRYPVVRSVALLGGTLLGNARGK